MKIIIFKQQNEDDEALNIGANRLNLLRFADDMFFVLLKITLQIVTDDDRHSRQI